MADVRKVNIIEEAKSVGQIKTVSKKDPTGFAAIDAIPEVPFMGIIDIEEGDTEFYFINASRATIYIGTGRVDLGDALPRAKQAMGNGPEEYFYVFSPGDVIIVDEESYPKFFEAFKGSIASGFVRVYSKTKYEKIKPALVMELAELTLPVNEIAYPEGTSRPAPLNPAIVSINKKLEELSKATLNIDDTIKKQMEEFRDSTNALFII
jgi:hypothetical protein